MDPDALEFLRRAVAALEVVTGHLVPWQRAPAPGRSTSFFDKVLRSLSAALVGAAGGF
jgi:hypothetical protein